MEDIEAESLKWNRSLIMYVVGNTPTIGSIERFTVTQWNFIAKPKILYHSDGYFVIRMSSQEERDKVPFTDPYTLSNRPIILKASTIGFNFNEEVLKTILL